MQHIDKIAKMAPATTATMELLRCTPWGWKIRDPERHRKFRDEYPSWCSVPAKVYSAFWFILPLCCMGGYLILGWSLKLAFFCEIFPVAVALLLGICCCWSVTKPYTELLLTVAVCLVGIWSSAKCYILPAYFNESHVEGKFTAPDYSETQIAAIRNVTMEFANMLVIAGHVLSSMPQFVAMLYLSASQIVIILLWASHACCLLLCPYLDASSTIVGVGVMTIFSVFFFFLSFQSRKFLQLHYLASDCLERELKMNFEASQKADSILNHTLKNKMADAAGELELFLSTYDGPRHPFQKILTSLRRGMQMCQQRQAYLKLMAGAYQPRNVPCSLYTFGKSLASGRQLILEQFSAVWAKFDTVACEMILENALSNAFKHGCPQNPDVSFTISAGERCNESQRFPLVFRVANRTHPERPPITADFIQKLVDQVPENTGSRAVPALSDQVGGVPLPRHCQGLWIRFEPEAGRRSCHI